MEVFSLLLLDMQRENMLQVRLKSPIKTNENSKTAAIHTLQALFQSILRSSE